MLEVCLESPQPLCTLHSIQFSDFNIHIPQNEFLPTLENFQLTYSYSIIIIIVHFVQLMFSFQLGTLTANQIPPFLTCP